MKNDGYNTYDLMDKSADELKSNYKEMRDEARNRVAELKESEFSDSDMVKRMKFLNKSINRMNKDELVNRIAETDRFLSSKLSTVRGQEQYRDRTIEKMNDLGFDELNRSNWKEYSKFWRDSKAYIENQILKSEDLLDLFKSAKEHNISIANVRKNFDFYIKNMDNIEMLELNESRKRAYTMRELSQKLDSMGLLD